MRTQWKFVRTRHHLILPNCVLGAAAESYRGCTELDTANLYSKKAAGSDVPKSGARSIVEAKIITKILVERSEPGSSKSP